MKKIRRKNKNGAASFYVVAFSTLILVILAVSFASVIISEIARTSNDDLSQSAYDSALAGIEDAKLAYANYQRCAEASYTASVSEPTGLSDVTCADIMYWMEHPDCYMVAHILGRLGKDEKNEVVVNEVTDKTGDNNLSQAYTCVEIKRTLSDYRGSLNSNNPTKIVKAELSGVSIGDDVKAIRVSWYSNPGGETYNYNNFVSNRVAFQQVGAMRAATPPTIAVQLVQTATQFNMSQLLSSTTSSGETDRATVYLVPAKNLTAYSNPSDNNGYNYIAYNGSDNNIISSGQVAATNNQAKNLPYAVKCPIDSSAEFACTTDIYLPSPIGGTRSDSTFMLAINLPYGQPDTDFSIQYLCDGGVVCSIADGAGGVDEEIINDTQISIDSTGRANDLYRRIETRLESSDVSFPYQFYAIEGLNSDTSSYAIWKMLAVTSN